MMTSRARRTLFVLALSFVAATAATNAFGGKPLPPPPPSLPDPAIVFASSITGDLMVMNADGTNQRVVVAGQGGYTPDWSPDHTQIVFAGGAQGAGVYVVNLDGTGLRKVIATSGGVTRPVWSPEPVPGPTGKSQFRIAYRDRSYTSADINLDTWDLFIVNLDGSDRINVSNSPDFDEWFPTWSPTGSKVLCQVMSSYVSGQTVRDHFGLMDFVNNTYALRPYGGPLTGHWVRKPSWSKTQENLIVVEARVVWPAAGTKTNPDNYDLWLVKLDDLANPVRLTKGSGNEIGPSFSPDDSKIVFSGIWVIDVTGANQRQIRSGGYDPTWRRNP